MFPRMSTDNSKTSYGLQLLRNGDSVSSCWLVLLTLLSALPIAISQTQGETCIPLTGSTTCAAFNASSISTDSFLIGLYPFLRSVTDTASFDRELSAYVDTSYVQLKYGILIGCGNIDVTNNRTSNLYARFTTSVICNGVIQNSRDRCRLTEAKSLPLCADSCAQWAQSEARAASNDDLCLNPSNYTETQIRADFTNCALPADSLAGDVCIPGISNEPDNCGFGPSNIGLCTYCGAGGINSTDSCCNSSQAQSRCANVVLPTTAMTSVVLTAIPTPSTSGSSATSAGSDRSRQDSSSNGLSGAVIAGIVIGSVAALASLITMIILCVLCAKRRKRSDKAGNESDDLTMSKSAPPMKSAAWAGASSMKRPKSNSFRGIPTPEGFQTLPGGRIARLAPTTDAYSASGAPKDRDDASIIASSQSSHSRGTSVLQNEYLGPRMRAESFEQPSYVPNLDIPDETATNQSQPIMIAAPSIPMDASTDHVHDSTIANATIPIATATEDFATDLPSSSMLRDSGQQSDIPLTMPTEEVLHPQETTDLQHSEHDQAEPLPTSRETQDGTPITVAKPTSGAGVPDGFMILPGGRLARVAGSMTSSRPTSPKPQESATDTRSIRETIRSFQSTASPPPVYEYQVLPGGRRARVKTKQASPNDGMPRQDSKFSDIDKIAPPTPATLPQRRQSIASTTKSRLAKTISSTGNILSVPEVVGSKDQPVTPSPLALPFAQDRYTSNLISTGDKVGVIWAHEPQSPDEFVLERGDSIRVLGMYNDGWATGVLLNSKSSVFEGSRETIGSGEVKAFPLACVCLLENWEEIVKSLN